MDGGNVADVDQEPTAADQQEFKPPIELPKGWTQEMYEEFANLRFPDEIDGFIDFQHEQQDTNPDMEVVDKEKVMEMKRNLLMELGKKFEKIVSKIEQLDEEQKKLVSSPALQGNKSGIVHSMNIKKREHDERVAIAKKEQDNILPRLKNEKQALEEELASFPELVKPGFFASKGVKENYTGRKYDKQKLEKQISELGERIESASKEADIYQKQIDDSAEILKKELAPLEQKLAKITTDEKYKQDSARLHEVSAELKGLNEILDEESDELIDAYNFSALGVQPEERPEWLDRKTGSISKRSEIVRILSSIKTG